MGKIKFSSGINIAIKIPKSKYNGSVSFYRDILKLEVSEKSINNPTVSRTHEVRSEKSCQVPIAPALAMIGQKTNITIN